MTQVINRAQPRLWLRGRCATTVVVDVRPRNHGFDGATTVVVDVRRGGGGEEERLELQREA